MTSWPRPSIIVVLLFGLLCVVAASLAVVKHSQLVQEKHRWDQVVERMSHEEVRTLLGNPDSVYPPTTYRGSYPPIEITMSDQHYERWAYGHRRAFVLKPSYPFYGPSFDGSYGPCLGDRVVYFTRGGRVVDKRYSYDGIPTNK